MSSDTVLACDVGGTRLRVAIVGPRGAVLHKEAVATPGDDPGALGRSMRQVLEKARKPIAGAVVGVPGPVDYSRGEALKLPNLAAWEGSISVARLSADVVLSVLLANDADLAALGEHRYGAGRGSQDMLYVASSTGVGAGVIIAGRLLHGRLSLAEVGHTIIDRGTGETLEGLGSGTALTRAAGEDAAVVTSRAAHGDPDALRHVAGAADALAIGVFNLVHCFSPEIVVIGGGMSQADELLLQPIRKRLGRCGPTCRASRARVVKAEGGDDVGLLGGFAYWMDCKREEARVSAAGE